MHVVRWQADLRPSALGRRLLVSMILAGVAGLLLTPWYSLWWVCKPLLIIAVIYEGYLGWQRLSQRQGRLCLTDQEVWLWQQQEWRLSSALSWLSWGVRVCWRSGKQRQCFWLMRDAMSEQAWRNLRMYWLIGRNRQWK